MVDETVHVFAGVLRLQTTSEINVFNSNRARVENAFIFFYENHETLYSLEYREYHFKQKTCTLSVLIASVNTHDTD
jgi:hypothetical protein